MQTLSSALLQSANAIDGAPPWGYVAELAIAGVSPPFRITSDVVPTVFHGITYAPFPVKTEGLETSSEDVIQRVRMTVPNIDGQIIALCEQYWVAVAEPDWTVSLWAVDFTQPDQTPLTFREVFNVNGVTTDFVNAEFDLAAAGKTLSGQVPGRRYNAASNFNLIPRF